MQTSETCPCEPLTHDSVKDGRRLLCIKGSLVTIILQSAEFAESAGNPQSVIMLMPRPCLYPSEEDTAAHKVPCTGRSIDQQQGKTPVCCWCSVLQSSCIYTVPLKAAALNCRMSGSGLPRVAAAVQRLFKASWHCHGQMA